MSSKTKYAKPEVKERQPSAVWGWIKFIMIFSVITYLPWKFIQYQAAEEAKRPPPPQLQLVCTERNTESFRSPTGLSVMREELQNESIRWYVSDQKTTYPSGHTVYNQRPGEACTIYRVATP